MYKATTCASSAPKMFGCLMLVLCFSCRACRRSVRSDRSCTMVSTTCRSSLMASVRMMCLFGSPESLPAFHQKNPFHSKFLLQLSQELDGHFFSSYRLGVRCVYARAWMEAS